MALAIPPLTGESVSIFAEDVPMADVLFLLKPGFVDAKAGPGEFY